MNDKGMQQRKTVDRRSTHAVKGARFHQPVVVLEHIRYVDGVI